MPFHKPNRATENKALITQYTNTSNNMHKLKMLVNAANMLIEGN